MMVFGLLVCEGVFSQDTATDTVKEKRSKFECALALNVNQLGITKWAGGGESNGSVKGTADLKHTFKGRYAIYTTTGYFSYGVSSYFNSHRTEKNEDRCEVSLTLNQNNHKNLSFTSLARLKTQFSDGFTYPNDSVPISRFFAPGYITISVGYTYTPISPLSIFFSPAAGKLTFVLDQTLADKGAFGVEKGYWDHLGTDSIWVPGKNFLGELGFNILVKYKQDFKTLNMSVFSTVNFYNNYMDQNRSNRWNIDVDWESGLTLHVNKRISTVFNVHLVYDDNVEFEYTENVDGVEVTKQRPELQFKESFGISFLYKFAN